MRGFKEIEGIDHEEVFVPMDNQITTQMFIAAAKAKGLVVEHFDVCMPFLHGDLEEVIYCEQPLGFTTGDPGQKCQVAKEFDVHDQEARRHMWASRSCVRSRWEW